MLQTIFTTKIHRWLGSALLVLGVLVALHLGLRIPAMAAESGCSEGVQESGAHYAICVPEEWNGTLLVFAHGYIPPDEPLLDPPPLEDTPVEEVVNLQGYALAASSFSTNGLAVLEGVEDLVDLVEIFEDEVDEPDRILIAGASMGGLIATLAVEEWPQRFDGGLALCGPYGDFRTQVNYFGDFRTVFDYFFPDLMPGTTVEIPPDLIENWDEHFVTKLLPELLDPANADALDQLFAVTDAAYATAVPFSRIEVVRRLLWYNVIATDDAIVKLTGQPYDNTETVYSGSDDDDALNADIDRYAADDEALDLMEEAYQSSGDLEIPLVTMHTTGDPLVPYAQAEFYAEKIEDAGSDDYYDHFLVDRFEHCLFTDEELLTAFERLEELVDGNE